MEMKRFMVHSSLMRNENGYFKNLSLKLTKVATNPRYHQFKSPVLKDNNINFKMCNILKNLIHNLSLRASTVYMQRIVAYVFNILWKISLQPCITS